MISYFSTNLIPLNFFLLTFVYLSTIFTHKNFLVRIPIKTSFLSPLNRINSIDISINNSNIKYEDKVVLKRGSYINKIIYIAKKILLALVNELSIKKYIYNFC